MEFTNRDWDSCVLGVVNSMGTKYGGIVQTVTTVGKMIPIVLIVVLGFGKGIVISLT